MHEPDRPADQIEQIHAIMARSSTFFSLSGLAGVLVGILALIATSLVYRLLGTPWLFEPVFSHLRTSPELVASIRTILVWTLVGALALAFFFTWRKARWQRDDLWNLASRRFGMHLALPLLAGGVFVLAFDHYGVYELVFPALLVFFGLALMSAGKYSFSETVLFGATELALGLAAVLWVEAGLILWAIGFGLVTPAYGMLMYLQYER